MEPGTFTIDDGCQRFPLTSTSTWSGFRPRSVASRMMELMLPPAWLGRVNDGRTLLRISSRPGLPVCSRGMVLQTLIPNRRKPFLSGAVHLPSAGDHYLPQIGGGRGRCGTCFD